MLVLNLGPGIKARYLISPKYVKTLDLTVDFHGYDPKEVQHCTKYTIYLFSVNAVIWF